MLSSLNTSSRPSTIMNLLHSSIYPNLISMLTPSPTVLSLWQGSNLLGTSPTFKTEPRHIQRVARLFSCSLLIEADALQSFKKKTKWAYYFVRLFVCSFIYLFSFLSFFIIGVQGEEGFFLFFLEFGEKKAGKSALPRRGVSKPDFCLTTLRNLKKKKKWPYLLIY